MSEEKVCGLHKDTQDALNKHTEILAGVKTDVSWIKQHIADATENKKWIVGTILAFIALIISIVK